MDARYPYKDFWQAVRDSCPILLGLFPFGLTCGVMGLAGGLKGIEIILMSLIVFAGSAQFIAITMLGTSIAFGAIIFTTLLVNLRYLLMGASLAPFMLKQPFLNQSILSFLLTDESYALTISRINGDNYSFPYHLGASLPIYIVWITSTISGVLLGSYIPNPLAWGLDFAMPATFMVLLFPRLTNKISIVVCMTAALISILGVLYLPGKWYIIIACVVGTTLGGVLEELRGERNNAA